MINSTFKGKGSTKLMSVFGMIAIVVILLGNSSNPPNAHTGAPGEGLCSNCHSGTSSIQGDIMVSGLPAQIMPLTPYDITVTLNVTSGTAVRGGFQLVALGSTNNNVGTFSSPGSNVAFEPSGGRTYAEHRPFKNFSGNNAVDFTFTWTSPATIPGDQMTFYFAGNLADGNGGTSGDRIVNSSISATLIGGVTDPEVEIVDVQNVLCFNGNNGQATALASEGVPPYSYSWSNGAQTATITNLIAGTYTVTVTDSNTASVTASIMITQPSELQISLVSNPTITCLNPEVAIVVDVTGGVSPYLYNWSNGGTESSTTVSEGGIYSVLVTDANSCTKTLNVTVIENLDIPDISAGPDKDIPCFEGVVSLDGTGPLGSGYFIEWSSPDGNILSGGNTYTPVVDAVGLYILSVIDIINGCEAIDQASVLNIPEEISLATIAQNVSCFGQNDGSLQLMVTGGVAPFQYSWSNGASTQNISNLAPGSYSVTVSDNNNCSAITSADVSQPAELNLMVQTTPISGPGEQDGTASGNASGGILPYTYLWSNGENTQDIIGLGPGLYTLTITDANGCTVTASGIVLSLECELEATLVRAENLSCFGSGDGLIEVLGENGDGEIAYEWSNGMSGAIISNLSAGIYTVTVTDENSCIATLEVVVDQNEDITIEISFNNESGEGTSDGDISVTVTGGLGIYSYEWSTGGTTAVLDGLTAGVYGLTVTDSEGCTKSTSVVLVTCDLESEIFMWSPIVCFGDSNGILFTTAESSYPPVSFLWSNGVTSELNIDLAPGIYSLTITDASTCSMVNEFELIEPDPLIVQTVEHTMEITQQGTGRIEVFVSGGNPEVYLYNWIKDGQSFAFDVAVIENLDAGLYELQVIDRNECLWEGEFNIELVSSTENEQAGLHLPKVFPNPAYSHLNLSWTGSLPGPIRIQISNLQGIVTTLINADSKTDQLLTIPVEHLPNGMYLINIYGVDRAWVLPFVKQ
jgi:hypothetical protein